ncbi:hypothetical protein R1flu_018951 [Riccia fluitans]|uniref:Uncharacterized protein n=1 Tax=Riccia fluitans TaxID=41844 RepID=A0ABD1ZHG4_9MARC
MGLRSASLVEYARAREGHTSTVSPAEVESADLVARRLLYVSSVHPQDPREATSGQPVHGVGGRVSMDPLMWKALGIECPDGEQRRFECYLGSASNQVDHEPTPIEPNPDGGTMRWDTRS